MKEIMISLEIMPILINGMGLIINNSNITRAQLNTLLRLLTQVASEQLSKWKNIILAVKNSATLSSKANLMKKIYIWTTPPLITLSTATAIIMLMSSTMTPTQTGSPTPR